MYESLSNKLLREQSIPISLEKDNLTEWFMLAKSAYKLKKYGECLYAIS